MGTLLPPPKKHQKHEFGVDSAEQPFCADLLHPPLAFSLLDPPIN